MSTEFKVEDFVNKGGLTIRDIVVLKVAELKELAAYLELDITPGMKKADMIKIVGECLQVVVKQRDSSKVELAKMEMERRLEIEKEVQMEKLRLEHTREMKRMELQGNAHSGGTSSPNFYVAKNIRLVPKFYSKDVDAWFVSFEKVANSMKWPERYWPLLLQSVLQDKAQEVYSALSESQSSNYQAVKTAILTAYELVPEAYRQKFRNRKREVGQTHVEYARAKEILFDKWCRAKQIGQSFEKLKELILMEEFKNNVSLDIKTHLDGRKIDDLKTAATMADDYELSHRARFGGKPRWSQPQGNLGGGKAGDKKNESSQSTHTKEGSGTSGSGTKSGSSGRNFNKWPEGGPRCFKCNKRGHVKANCPELKGQESGKPVALVTGEEVRPPGEQLVKPVVILRDTGASQTVLVEGVIPLSEASSRNASALVRGLDGNYIPAPLHKVFLTSDLVKGSVTVAIVPQIPVEGVDLLLGNDLAGAKVCVAPHVTDKPVVSTDTEVLEDQYPGIFPACVVTRSQSRKVEAEEVEDLGVDPSEGVWLAETFFADLDNGVDKGESGQKFTRESLINEQKADPALRALFQTALSEEEAEKVPTCYYIKHGVLMRKWRPVDCPADEDWRVVYQIVLPLSYRENVLHLAHDVPMGGHLGVVGKPNQVVKPVPLIPIPAFGEPFSKVVVDCVGLLPRTKSGFKYLLTVMDTSTRFPEVIPLKKITSRCVVDALLQLFTNYGLPREVQSDQGSTFYQVYFKRLCTSKALTSWCRLPITPSPRVF
ncbi:hypothetical protein HOLleu_34157 [Holothuria leucospilota]|uniref:Uncharacterized protein n=1 Tax=Holothuria leucospilota TaxID=206669 RepID=A0A9Q0YSY7_HOLLE|nr:hypothetical protein HOLleu_34157 [Holothuria leucospilota]